MREKKTFIVAIEDYATAGVVATRAAQLAQEVEADELILLHVLDEHPLLNAIFGMANYSAPVQETREEADEILTIAEAVVRGEYNALGRPAPTMRHEIANGHPAEVIEATAVAEGACGIILGARRPHALGRLTHPDVRAHITTHLRCGLHVASLQELPSEAHLSI